MSVGGPPAQPRVTWLLDPIGDLLRRGVEARLVSGTEAGEGVEGVVGVDAVQFDLHRQLLDDGEEVEHEAVSRHQLLIRLKHVEMAAAALETAAAVLETARWAIETAMASLETAMAALEINMVSLEIVVASLNMAMESLEMATASLEITVASLEITMETLESVMV